MVKENKLLNTKPKRSKRIAESKRKRKVEESSDDDSYLSEESEEYNESEEEMDPVEYRKLLSSLFPSKYMNKKVKATEKMQEIEENLSKKSKKRISSTDSDSEIEEVPVKQKSKKNKTQSKKKNKDEDDDEDYSEEDVNVDEKTGKKFNIIFTIGNSKNDDSYEDYYEDDEDEDWETDDEDTENEDESVSSDSDTSSEEEEIQSKNKSKSIQNKEKQTIKEPQPNDEESTKEDTENYKSNVQSEPNEELLILLKGLHKKNANKEMIEECIKVCEDKIKNTKKKSDKKKQKHKDKNERIFRKILADKNTMNDFTFFNKMNIEEQIKIIKELREINRITRIEKPYRLTLLESDIPTIFKASAMKKISSLRYMEPGSGEFYKIKNWVDNFMRIPFGKVETLPIHISDGVDTCHNFMEDAKKKLDSAVYGLNDAKMQIMQMLGQLITNPKAIGSAIAIHGPPGTGKTSLVKEGISKILNRPFAFIALGGATDSSFLEGHGYTYEGSTWGKIVQILMECKSMNPIIYFDELDKVSDTPKGEEIIGILTHLTDTTQNNQFHDKFFSEIDFDVSKCLFI